MLSTRGQAHADSGLMSGYLKEKKEAYNKATNPQGLVSFANAENFLMQDVLLKYINSHHAFDPVSITYNEGPVGTRRLRNAMASHINDNFSPFSPVTIDQITFTTGITALNEMMTFNLTDEGEAILLGRPIYGSFYGDLMTKSKCKLVYTSFSETDQFSPNAVAKYEEAYLQAQKEGIKIKVLLLCNPHNPLGRCYPAETLIALFQLCQKYGIHLISDEVYALSVFGIEGEREKTPFTSVLSINPTGLLDTNLLHVMYGMSKDFGAAGLRLGCLITKNEAMTAATQAIGRFHWPSELSCAIATAILEDKRFVGGYTRKSRVLLGENYKLSTALLDKAGIDYYRDGNAGFFIWIDLAPFLAVQTADEDGWKAEKSLSSQLEQHGVVLSSGFNYKAERPGWFRVIFSVDKQTLEEGIRRIAKVCRG